MQINCMIPVIANKDTKSGLVILEFRGSIKKIETSTKEKVYLAGLIFSERRPLSVSSQDAATTPMQ